MSFTVRDVITEALARSGLCSRRQQPQGNMVENAERLLQGVAADYSNHNLLQFLRREVKFPDCCNEEQYVLGNGYRENMNFWFIRDGYTGVLPEADFIAYRDGYEGWEYGGTHVYTVRQAGPNQYAWDVTNYSSKEEAMAHLNGAIVKIIPPGIKPVNIIGEVDPEIESDWVDAHIDNIASITQLYWDRSTDPMANASVNLEYVSFEDFNNSAFGIYVYTWQHISDTKIELKFHPRFLAMLNGTANSLTMTYNVKYEFDLNSVLKIPDIYKELFICALTYKLACEYPRLSPEHTERLRLTMVDIENSIKTPTRANKMIKRVNECIDGRLQTTAQLLSGSFIFGN